jgi:type I restriction enzyme R subunit
MTPDALLWQRLGQKTHELIAKHINDVEVGKGGPKSIVLDEQSIEQLKLLGLDDVPAPGDDQSEPPTAADVMDSIRKRLEARLQANPSSSKYTSLAARLEALRQTYIESAEESVEFLKKLLEIAREVVQADRAQVAEEGASAVADDGTVEESLLPDQRVGALTQIFEEYRPEVTPEIVERVVHEIDAVVMGIRFTGWQTSRVGDRTVKFEIRRAFRKFGLDPTGELFDRAYAYVAEHY